MSSTPFPEVLATLIDAQDLPAPVAERVMDAIVAGAATTAQVAAFAALLRAKGETATELAALAASLRRHGRTVAVDGPAVDLVGTGGDGADTVNISTMAALVVAGTGRRVVKHGARAASSACGTADVLQELGVHIDLPAAGVAATLAASGIGFCFAPVFHAGLRHAAQARAELGVRTVFNLLGPLINPARPPASLVGCADADRAHLLAAAFAERGDRALVVRGDDGLDELTTTTTSTVWIAAGGRVERRRLDPAALGVPVAAPGALRGGDRVHNATVVRTVLAGERGPVRDAVVLNAAAAIAVHDTAERVLDALPRALREAAHTIDSGAAAAVLQDWIASSTRAALGAGGSR